MATKKKTLIYFYIFHITEKKIENNKFFSGGGDKEVGMGAQFGVDIV